MLDEIAGSNIIQIRCWVRNAAVEEDCTMADAKKEKASLRSSNCENDGQ